MQKWWSVFFGVVLAATFGLWIVAPFAGWWLPPNVASYGDQVDDLFYVILGFTGFFFLLTEVLLVYCLWRFAYREGHKSTYTHGNHWLEVFWTAVPAGILLFISFAQIKAWENIKYQSRMPPPDMTVQVTGRQWEWRMRYPYDTARFNYTNDTDPTQVHIVQRAVRYWAEAPEADDIHVPNELHVWQGANVKLYLRTLDVLHSFYLPNLRLKQDALPGKTIPMWFKATASNTVRYENEWLGNKDPQKWPDELGLSKKLLEEASKTEQAAEKDKEAKAKDKVAASREEAKKARAEAATLRADVASLKSERATRPELANVGDEPDDLRAAASKIRYAAHRDHSWEIACAELCGARHAYMKGRLYVHPTREDYAAWLAHAYRQQTSRQP